MGSFSISEEIIGYLDNESNKLIIGKHLLDSFKETYTVNSAVLVDASNAIDYLKFSDLLRYSPYDLYKWLEGMYIDGFFSAVTDKYNVTIDPTLRTSGIGDIDVCASKFVSQYGLNTLKMMCDNPQKYIDKFVKYAEKHDADFELYVEPVSEENYKNINN